MGQLRYGSMIIDLSTSWKLLVSFTALSLNPGERTPGSQLIRGWMGSRAGLDAVEQR
jgi:hypothetical protein